MPSTRLKTLLDDQRIKYVTVDHSLAFTAIDIAVSADIPAKTMAKTVIVTINDEMAMLILPAAYRINMDLLQEAFPDDVVSLADEQSFSRRFPDCEVGAMPPFGNLYEMEVFVAESITEHDEIAFNAGSHTEIIKMRYKDYEDLVKPRFVLLAT